MRKFRLELKWLTRNAHLGNGIRFIRISDTDKEKLREFVESAQKNTGCRFAGRRRLGPAE